MTTKDYQALAPSIPRQPGVYRFINGEDTILYVGKAKNLKSRLSSYFGDRKGRARKTKVLVKNAKRIEFTVVETEADALLLESTLIKKYQPRYNVALKDGKTYTYLVIKDERFPRVFLTRRLIKDGSTYFGPYTSKARIKIILDLIKTLFPLRTCNYKLSEENIESGKFKVCLEYHIKNCLGPCEGLESEAHYNQKIEQIKNMLKGNFAAVKNHFKEEMNKLAVNMEFEKAAQIKDKLTAFDNYQGKSTMVSPTLRDIDVFTITGDEKLGFVNYIKVLNGVVVNTYSQELVKNLDDDDKELLEYAIVQLRDKFNSIAPEIVVPFPITPPSPSITVTIPKIGDKKKLLDLSQKNGKYFMLQRKREDLNKLNRQTPAERILRTLQADLQMDQLPLHIECFDNSNMQGSFPVASCVVFKNAKPSKKDYRHFNIKTVVGPDDFASMKEVVHRRYRRLLDEDRPLPQLIIIDGGKGQLSSAVESLKVLGLEKRITIIGIAKRLEEIFFPDDPIPLYINKKSESLKLIQQLRNEAHRFAITFHRLKRSQNFTSSELTNIPGIGTKTAAKLLSQFGSVKKIKKAPYQEIEKASSKKVADAVTQYFRSKE